MSTVLYSGDERLANRPEKDQEGERAPYISPDIGLSDLWYFAMPSRKLKRGKLLAKRMFDLHLVFGRDSEGRPFAMQNSCRHQAMPLSLGRFDGKRLECPNHGWLYDTDGQCVSIPCLSEKQPQDISRIRIKSFPCRDVQGNVWIYAGRPSDDIPDPPRLPEVEAKHLRVDGMMRFACGMDRATLGLIDPAHGPYVHTSWLRRSDRDRREKEKRFVPSHLGFTMARHSTKTAQALWFMPKSMEIEVSFQLPGVHFECVRAGKHVFTGMITATPLTANETQVNYNLYWTIPWLAPAQPVVALLMHNFFAQDQHAMAGLSTFATERTPPLTLVGDPDQQAVWYFKLKQEYLRAKKEGRPFENPVQETVLRWRT
ncbi:MAG: aromatic ring-hydroxylating dioxygenase subunit alpha [Hydrogenophilaceae bacterium]|nr:aromatic ring-hydroxylating dioxygenase subunit alpha [Hydrogenophilaceae bacterium]